MENFKYIRFLAMIVVFFSTKTLSSQTLTTEDMTLGNLVESFSDEDYNGYTLSGLEAIGALMQGTQGKTHITPQASHLQGIKPLDVFGRDIVFQNLPEQQQEALKKWAMFPTETLEQTRKQLLFKVFAYFGAAFEKENKAHYLWAYKLVDEDDSTLAELPMFPTPQTEDKKTDCLNLEEIEKRTAQLQTLFDRYNALKQGELAMLKGLEVWEKRFQDAAESDNQDVRDGIKSDIDCLKEIAQMGIAHAQLLCGYIYNQGICGIERDSEVCEVYFKSAADQKHLWGNVFLAGLLQKQERYQEAFPHWDFAARNGYPFALCVCAEMLEGGVGVAKNLTKAMECYNTYSNMIERLPAQITDVDSRRFYIDSRLFSTFANIARGELQKAKLSLEQLVKFILPVQQVGEETTINYAEVIQEKAAKKLVVWAKALKDETVKRITEQERHILFPEVEEAFYPYFKATLQIGFSKLLAGDYLVAYGAMNAAFTSANTCLGTPPVGTVLQSVFLEAYELFEANRISKELPMHYAE